MRGRLFVDLDRLSLDIRGSVTATDAGASYYESLPLLPGPVPEIDLLFGGPLGRLGSDISRGTFENHSNVQTTEEREVGTFSAMVDLDLAGGILTSVTGYNNSEQYDYGDLNFQPIDVLIQNVRFDVEVFNQEIRFASDLGTGSAGSAACSTSAGRSSTRCSSSSATSPWAPNDRSQQGPTEELDTHGHDRRVRELRIRRLPEYQLRPL